MSVRVSDVPVSVFLLIRLRRPSPPVFLSCVATPPAPVHNPARAPNAGALSTTFVHTGTLVRQFIACETYGQGWLLLLISCSWIGLALCPLRAALSQPPCGGEPREVQGGE